MTPARTAPTTTPAPDGCSDVRAGITPLPDGEADRVAALALAEDLAAGADVTTTATVPQDLVGTADLVARAAGTIAGLGLARAVLERCLADSGLPYQVVALVRDGDTVAAGEAVMTVSGQVRAILVAERSALNLLGRLSGIATLTARWVAAVAGTGAVIRDTRKTTPGLRQVEKYAVRCGGGANHRMGLADQALIKDNHLAAAGGVAPALEAVRAAAPDLVCEVECDTLEQVEQAAALGAALVLLDNMTLEQTRRAVEIARRHGTRTEASGGLRLDVARDVAATGVDYLAVGALTHSAPTLDIGLDLRAT